MHQDTNKSFEIELHDIKPLVEIEEYSLYYLLGISFVLLVLITVVVYFAYKWFESRNRFNQRVENLKIINALDMSKTKDTAYTLSILGVVFKDDSLRHQEMYENLRERLSEYKYKKDVGEFDGETKGYIELYKSMLDV